MSSPSSYSSSSLSWGAWKPLCLGGWKTEYFGVAEELAEFEKLDELKASSLLCDGLNVLCCENERGFKGLLAPSIELPRIEDGGGPAGVKDPAEEGGGPAGVVEGFDKPNIFLPLLDLLSGVDGGLEE